MNLNSSLQFLSKLKDNNNKDWFDANRKTYDEIKSDWIKFIEKLIIKTSKIDINLGNLEAKDCMFRINRDVRFSPNKAPYKSNIAISITKGGKKSIYAGCYLHIEPDNKSFIAGGLYLPEKEILQKIRTEIDYKPELFDKIISEKNFIKYFESLTGDKLSKAPKGFDPYAPHIELLKQKSFLGWHKLSDKKILEINLEEYFLDVYKTLMPLNEYLNKAIDFKD
ncbi:MAG: DUF2461 domain-containing protein [Cytophagales bacterium]|nr:MAG: DUF2461 domain-containing protein [Cytophagales bacterium]